MFLPESYLLNSWHGLKYASEEKQPGKNNLSKETINN